ncbi:MAG: M48 family metalloprotease [Planctomycetota bacterium]|nr:M48 family metalloprotease [Planctomycetota bacterium]
MPALGTMFIAVLLWYVVPGFDGANGSWFGRFDPGNGLLIPSLSLLLIPALVTLISLRLSSKNIHGDLSKRLSSAHRKGMLATLLTWITILSLGNWFEVTHSSIPSTYPGLTAVTALAPLFVGMSLTSVPLSWYSGRRSGALLLEDFWQHGRPYLILLIPIAALSGLEEWLLLHPDRLASVPGPQWLIPVSLYLVIVILGSPLLLQLMLSSRPMPAGSRSSHLMSLAERGGIRCGTPRIWNTGSRAILNAMVTGLLPFQRKIFITDQLLQVSSRDELDAVFAHELAHARHGHLWLYLLAGIGFIFTALLVESEYTGSTDLIWMGVMVILFWIFFGRLSHQLEHQADIVSDELTGQPGAIAQALARIAVLGSGLQQRGGWRHPPILERIRVLHHYREDPQFRDRFQRRGRRLVICIVLLVAIPGSALLLEAADTSANSTWQRQYQQGLAYLEAVEELRSRPGGEPQRQRELLQGSEQWIRQGITELRQRDPAHPELPVAYLILASIYDQLDQPWNATACRILSGTIVPQENPPTSK